MKLKFPKEVLQNKENTIMKKTTGKSMVVLLICLLLFSFTVSAVACPPPQCDECERLVGDECVYRCSSGQCCDIGIGCVYDCSGGCTSCSEGYCTSECNSCQTCEDDSCVCNEDCCYDSDCATCYGCVNCSCQCTSECCTDSDCGNPDCWDCVDCDCECDITINSVSSDKDAACVNCDITFTAYVTGSCSCVDWSGGGDPATASDTCTFTTHWDSPGTKTVTATPDCGDGAKQKQVTIVEVDKVVKAGTTNEGPLYVCLNSTVDLEAKPNPTGASFPSGEPNWSIVSQPSGASASLNPSSGTAATTLDNLTEPGHYIVKAKCGNNDTGDNITVTAFKIKSETVSPIPANRDRTTLGIGEEVICSTEPSVSVDWRVNGGGRVSPTSGTSTTFTASKSPSMSIVHAELGTNDCTLVFRVVAPNGMNAVLKQDLTPGVPGPPNDRIGAASRFTCTVLRTSVSFYAAEFQENIPTNTWTWPDGTQESNPAHTVAWSVGYDNRATDGISDSLRPIGRIHDGSSYVNFNYIINVPEEYKNENNQWILWLPYETHPREFRGSDQKARVILNATNSANGGWMGPWQ